MKHNIVFLAAVRSLALAVLAGTTLLPVWAQELIPNDPIYNQQYGLHYTQAPLAWGITTGSTRVTVAINDTGIDYTHPDLYLNIWINQDEIPSRIRSRLTDVDADGLITFWDLNDSSGINIGAGKIVDLNGNGRIDGGDVLRDLSGGGWADGKDNGHNGYVDDIIGWDFFGDDNDPMDEAGHGTASARIIGAIGNNGEGVAGINWKVRMMPVRLLPRGGGIENHTPEELAIAINATPRVIAYATDNGARVSNNSYGAPENIVPEKILLLTRAVIQKAAAAGQLMVFSAGNDTSDNDTFPAEVPASFDLPNILSVAATTRADKLANFSNFGATTVHLRAPGKTVWTTIVDDYFHAYGTSFSAPHVVGAAALMLSVNPNLTYAELKTLILGTVDPLEELEGITVTGGRLNIGNAVTVATVL